MEYFKTGSLKVQFRDQEHLHLLGTCQKCKFSGPLRPTKSETMGLGSSDLCFNQPTGESENLCFKGCLDRLYNLGLCCGPALLYFQEGTTYMRVGCSSRIICCHCLITSDMRGILPYFFVWHCYRQTSNSGGCFGFPLLIMTNGRKQNAINPCFQGYLLAADNRQEIKTICDRVLFLLATDGSFQICWSKT